MPFATDRCGEVSERVAGLPEDRRRRSLEGERRCPRCRLEARGLARGRPSQAQRALRRAWTRVPITRYQPSAAPSELVHKSGCGAVSFASSSPSCCTAFPTGRPHTARRGSSRSRRRSRQCATASNVTSSFFALKHDLERRVDRALGARRRKVVIDAPTSSTARRNANVAWLCPEDGRVSPARRSGSSSARARRPRALGDPDPTDIQVLQLAACRPREQIDAMRARREACGPDRGHKQAETASRSSSRRSNPSTSSKSAAADCA